jgi:hypothetical protein
MKILLSIFIVFLTQMSFALIIPLKSSSLNFENAKNLKLKKGCQHLSNLTCYELWDENTFISIYISPKDKNFNIKNECSGKVKNNQHNIPFCKKNDAYVLLKGESLISISIKTPTNDFNELKFIGGIK